MISCQIGIIPLFWKASPTVTLGFRSLVVRQFGLGIATASGGSRNLWWGGMASAGARAYMGVWGPRPQWGPGAKPLVGGQGAKPPWSWRHFHNWGRVLTMKIAPFSALFTHSITIRQLLHNNTRSSINTRTGGRFQFVITRRVTD